MIEYDLHAPDCIANHHQQHHSCIRHATMVVCTCTRNAVAVRKGQPALQGSLHHVVKGGGAGPRRWQVGNGKGGS